MKARFKKGKHIWKMKAHLKMKAYFENEGQ